MNEEFEEDYAKARGLLHTNQDLPDRFCIFYKAVETIKPETFSPSIKEEVKSLFHDVNTEIEKYNEQYDVLVNELGILCGIEANEPVVARFFKSYLDLLGLAYNLYKDYPEMLTIFLPLLQNFVVLLETNKIQLPEDPLQKALLVELMKSAWALTQPEKNMKMYAKQLGGRNKRQTRKGVRKSIS